MADSWEQYVDGLAVVEASAAHVGQLALYDMCVLMRRRLTELAAEVPAPSGELLTFVNLWPMLVASWLESAQDAGASDQLMAFLNDARWPTPFAESEAGALRGLLYLDDPAAEAPPQHADDGHDDDDGPILTDLYVDVSHDLVIGGKSMPSAPRHAVRTSPPADVATAADPASEAQVEPAASAVDAHDAIDDALAASEARTLEQVESLLEEMAGAGSLADDGSAADEHAPAHDTAVDHAEALLAGLDDLEQMSTATTEDGDASPGAEDAATDEEFLEVAVEGDPVFDDGHVDHADEDEDEDEPAFIRADELAGAWADDDAGGFDDRLETATFTPNDAENGDAADTGALALHHPPADADDDWPAEPATGTPAIDAADHAADRGVPIDDDAFLAPDDIPEHVDGEARLSHEHDALLGPAETDDPLPIEAFDGGDDFVDAAGHGPSLDVTDAFGDDDGAQAWSQPSMPDWVPGDDEPDVAAAHEPQTGATGAGELPAAAREMVALLALEASQTREVLTETLAVARDAGAGHDARRQVLAHFAEQIERFTGAVELLGLGGLAEGCNHLYENVLALAGRDSALSEAEAAVLEETCVRIESYLGDLPRTAGAESLAALLAAPAWPAPLDQARREAVAAQLASAEVNVDDDDAPARETTATREDVSLRLPDDVDAEVLDGLLQDLPGQTAEFSAAVSRVIAGGTLQDLEVAQRIAHTVKGAANTVGVAGIANLTHHVEDILLALTKHETFPGRSLGETLVSAADCLESMGEALLGQGPAPRDALEILQLVLDWANRIDVDGIAAVRADAPPAPRRRPANAHAEVGEEAEAPARLEESLADATPGDEPHDEPARGERQAQPGTTPMVRIPAPLVDELLRLAGENIILTGQIQERLALTAREAQSMRTQYSMVQQLGQELEELVDLHDLSLPRQRVVNGEEFDPLEFDQYNELHTCSRRLIEAAMDTRELGRNVEEHLAALVDMLVDQSRLNRENQEAVLHTRMVAVQTIVPRLQRSVRQASRLAGKAVTLECAGTDTMMDSDVLAGLLDPLMHMLRNAVDHGIEAEDVRMANGKQPGGQIRLEFQREGNHIVIRCQDDGGGLDLGAVRATAESRGLASAGENLSDDELIALVLRPNFSTRTQATQLSGRGIGLDAVNSRVVSLGGSLRLETEAGQGCRITLRLPLTLISTHALLVRATSHVVAVSTRGVEQILHPESGEVVHFGDQITFRVVDAVYPCTPLTQLLGLPQDRRSVTRSTHPALLVQTEIGLQAVLVDAVVDSRDLVVKSMGRYLPKIRGLAGATILGDGSVTPVLDLPELLREPAQEDVEASPADAGDPGIDVSMPFALVVDDSLSARRSLAQFIGDSGFQVRTARDGLEAIKVMQSRVPDILLVDLEMPRMNGLELTHHVRANESMRELPIIMITSRSTEKHRSQAEEAGVTRYLTKPFAESELIEHVYSVCGMR